MLITTIFFATIKVPYIVKGSIAIRSETSSVSAPTLELTDDSLATYSGIEMAIAPYGRDDIFFQTTSTEKDHSYKFEGDDLPEGVTILDTFCIDKNFRGDKKEVKLAIGPARAQGDAGEMKLDRLPGAAKWRDSSYLSLIMLWIA